MGVRDREIDLPGGRLEDAGPARTVPPAVQAWPGPRPPGRIFTAILASVRAPEWFRHAFAVDPAGAAEPTAAQRAVVDRLAHEVVRRRLTQPALLALEVCSPLNFVSAQGLQFFQPFVASVTDARGYEEFARFLQQRGSVGYIRDRIESLERAYAAREQSGPR
jgi:hypothetical protein